ncbi:MAG: tetratricopeptide repeat protein [bacterium]
MTRDHEPRPRPSAEDATLASDVALDVRGLTAVSIPGFVIRRKLGEGGMGVVYEAEQETPRRRVALKVVRGGPIADDVHVRLFKREADMLARLEHPNIAAIYASGRTPDGHHWFAMELVEGETLGAWLERTRERPRGAAVLRERLEIFRAVCDAVQYAHQRGVIHRDLKPSNLVVPPAAGAPSLAASASGTGSTASASRARVKVLDFGLARLTEPEPGAANAATEAGVVRGTLPYMSPEQARGDVDAVDVRSDVYSLGVILHEMLVDRRPYDIPTGLLDAIRTISEANPPPLAQDWPGPGRADADLETIVRKALAKAPRERYESAGALAEDVRRWLASEPILARPPSTAYQLRKLIARHRLPFAAAAVVLALIVASTVVTSILYLRSERNLTRAVAAEAKARSEARTAQETSDFLVGIFDLAKPERARAEQITAREILQRAAERLPKELADEPLVRARMMGTIGDVYHRLGMDTSAKPLLEESLKQREAHLGAESPEVAQSRNLLALALEDLGEFDAARAQYDQAIAFWEARHDTLREDFVDVLANYGWMLGEMTKYTEALPKLRRALAIVEALPHAKPQNVARVLGNLATVEMDMNDFDGARAHLERAMALLKQAGEEETLDFADHVINLGVVDNMSGKSDEALPLFQRGLAIREKFLDPETPEVVEAMGNVALAYAQGGQLDKAIPLMRQTAATMEKVFGPQHPKVSQALYNLGYALVSSGDPAGARAPLERSLALRERAFGKESVAVATVLASLADVNHAAGNSKLARAQLEKVLEIDSKELGPANPEVADDLDALASLLHEMGDIQAAKDAEARAKTIREAKPAKS